MSEVALPCILACVCEKWDHEEVSDQGWQRLCARALVALRGAGKHQEQSRGKLAAILHRVLTPRTAFPEPQVGTGAALTSPAAAATSSPCRTGLSSPHPL